jgi:hypothetical protein
MATTCAVDGGGVKGGVGGWGWGRGGACPAVTDQSPRGKRARNSTRPYLKANVSAVRRRAETTGLMISPPVEERTQPRLDGPVHREGGSRPLMSRKVGGCGEPRMSDRGRGWM